MRQLEALLLPLNNGIVGTVAVRGVVINRQSLVLFLASGAIVVRRACDPLSAMAITYHSLNVQALDVQGILKQLEQSENAGAGDTSQRGQDAGGDALAAKFAVHRVASQI